MSLFTMDKMILLLKLQVLSDGSKDFTTKKAINSGILFFNSRDTLFSVWKTNGKTSGYTKTVGYLELKTVNNAGHLVPMDQGEAALNLVKTFVNKCTGRTTT